MADLNNVNWDAIDDFVDDLGDLKKTAEETIEVNEDLKKSFEDLVKSTNVDIKYNASALSRSKTFKSDIDALAKAEKERVESAVNALKAFGTNTLNSLPDSDWKSSAKATIRDIVSRSGFGTETKLGEQVKSINDAVIDEISHSFIERYEGIEKEIQSKSDSTGKSKVGGKAIGNLVSKLNQINQEVDEWSEAANLSPALTARRVSTNDFMKRFQEINSDIETVQTVAKEVKGTSSPKKSVDIAAIANANKVITDARDAFSRLQGSSSLSDLNTLQDKLKAEYEKLPLDMQTMLFKEYNSLIKQMGTERAKMQKSLSTAPKQSKSLSETTPAFDDLKKQISTLPQDLSAMSEEELNSLSKQAKELSRNVENFKPTILPGELGKQADILKDYQSTIRSYLRNLGKETKEIDTAIEEASVQTKQLKSETATDQFRVFRNSQKEAIAKIKQNGSPAQILEQLQGSYNALENEAERLVSEGANRSTIESDLSTIRRDITSDITSVLPKVIKSYFKGNAGNIKQVIDSIGDDTKVNALDLPEHIKEILKSQNPGSAISEALQKLYQETISQQIKDANDGIKKNLDSLKADTVDKKGALKTASGRDERIKATKEVRVALSTYYDALSEAPEDIVSEADKANVRSEIANIQKALDDLINSVTDEIADLTKNIDDSIKEVKSSKSLSTKEKIAQVQGALGTLNNAQATTSGDTEALNKSKAFAQNTLSDLSAQAAKEATQQAKQATQQILSSVNSLVHGIDSAMTKVIGIIRRGLSLLNRAVNYTINSLRSILTGAQKVIQLVGSLSNRVRSFVSTLLSGNKAGQQTNVIVRSIGLTFTELNSILSLAERGFNALFNNKMLERALKFDSTIASITMLLGKEATQDVREFADALEHGFGIPATKTISDLQEISSLLKGVGIQTEYIADASEDLYSMANYMAALGMAGGDVSTVMTKLQSGLKGMTQSIDDLGLSVRETQMDAFLKNKNIDIKFSGLDEANREIVRLAAIIEQFRNGFNIKDYPTLLGQTYFRVELIKTQVEQIGTLIGKIFEGLLGQLLPYIMRALAMIKGAIIDLGNALGIDMDASKVEEGISSVKEATDSATKSTKKLDKATKEYTNTAGFDQIESLNSSSSKESGVDLSSLLDDVGSISDMLQKMASDTDGFLKILDKETGKKLKLLRKKIKTLFKDITGHKVDLSFGFDLNKAKESVKNIWGNVKGWWNSFVRTGLYVGIRFAEDLQVGRLANDLLSVIESITEIIETIQKALEPEIKRLYEKYISPVIKAAGDDIHRFSEDFKEFAGIVSQMFGNADSAKNLAVRISDLKKANKVLGNLAESILIVKNNWQGFVDIWNGSDTEKSKALRDRLPILTELEDVIRSITDLAGTLWKLYLKPLFDKLKSNLPTPIQFLQNIEDKLNAITGYLKSDVGQITIKDAASDVLEIIQTKVDAIKSSLEAVARIGIALITPTDSSGNVTSKADGGTSVLSLLADSNRKFYEEEFKPWIDSISKDISEFITEHKDDITDLIGDIRDFAWDRFKTVVDEIVKTIEYLVTHETQVRKVLDTIGAVFDTLVKNWEALVAVFVALKGLSVLTTGAPTLIKLFTSIGSLLGTATVTNSAGIATAIGASSLELGVGLVVAIGAVVESIIGEIKDFAQVANGIKTGNIREILDSLLDFLLDMFEIAKGLAQGGILGLVKSAVINKIREKLNEKYGFTDKAYDSLGIPEQSEKLQHVENTFNSKANELEEILSSAVAKESAGSTSQLNTANEKAAQDSISFWESLFEPRDESVDKVAENVVSIEQAQKNLAEAQKRGNIEDIKHWNSYIAELEKANKTAEETKEAADKATNETSKGSEKVKSAVITMNSDMKAAFDKIQTAVDAIKASVDSSSIGTLLQGIRDQISVVISKMDSAPSIKELDISESYDGTRGGYYQAQQYAKNVKIKGFASGGSIGKGNLFIANEDGSATELIGNITRKSGTDVANNKMITDAMEAAVYNGFADAFNQIRQNGSNTNNATQTINISGFGMIDKTTLKRFAQMLAPYLDANSKSLYAN